MWTLRFCVLETNSGRDDPDLSLKYIKTESFDYWYTRVNERLGNPEFMRATKARIRAYELDLETNVCTLVNDWSLDRTPAPRRVLNDPSSSPIKSPEAKAVPLAAKPAKQSYQFDFSQPIWFSDSPTGTYESN